MASIGGDIIEIRYSHPTLGSGGFDPKAAEDSTYDLGGFRTADEANSIAGSGDAIYQMSRGRWFFEVVCANDMNGRKDLEKLTALTSSPIEADWTFTHINGAVYQGKGKPVGDMQANGNSATFPLKVAGGGTLKQL